MPYKAEEKLLPLRFVNLNPDTNRMLNGNTIAKLKPGARLGRYDRFINKLQIQEWLRTTSITYMHHERDNVLESGVLVISITLIRQDTFSCSVKVFSNCIANVKYQHACLCTYLYHLSIVAALKGTSIYPSHCMVRISVHYKIQCLPYSFTNR